ncbi:hypothetical protein [Salinibacter grassmerensis]|uniref:hypothetical protein n=1 Tax=Salinibacter grassmerensis TaxID=3040353 RepID=UPI0021E795F4|nr:hypothetical protein [Salinibacter grassmerensis]
MSSPESLDKQNDRAEGEPSTEDISGAVAQTTECPNCRRTFIGDYCPSYGQAAEPPVSVTSVIGGFFRELVDIKNGF